MSQLLIGPDFNPHNWLTNTYCFQCRIGRVHYSNDSRVCSSCHAVQDFLLLCANPSCTSEGIPSWQFFKKPEELRNYHYFCSEKHAMQSFQVPSASVYGDSEQNTRYVFPSHTFPMSTTVSEYIFQVITSLFQSTKVQFILCFDEKRVPGNQINHVNGSMLLYNALVKYGTKGLFLITQTEYDAQMNSLCGRPFESTFWPTKGTHTQVVEWLKQEHGLVGTSLTEAGTDGPRTTKQPNGPYAVVTYISEDQLQGLLELGYPLPLICPFILRNKHIIVIIPCKAPSLCDSIHKIIGSAWKTKDDHIYTNAIYNSLNQDEEEEEEENEKKRPRTATTANTIADLATLQFTVVEQKKIIKHIRDTKPRTTPFCITTPNKENLYYICVPLTNKDETLIGQLNPHYVTRTCFLEYRLAMVPCASLETQKDVFDKIQKGTSLHLFIPQPPGFGAFQELFPELDFSPL